MPLPCTPLSHRGCYTCGASCPRPRETSLLGPWLRPITGSVVRPEVAPRVVAPAYDRLSDDERRRRRLRSADTFLHALPSFDGAEAASVRELAHCREAVERFRVEAFEPVLAPFVAVYRLVKDGATQTGLVCDLDVEALHDVVAGHEHTRRDREDAVYDYLRTVRVQSSPVCLTHAPEPELADTLAEAAVGAPRVELTHDDVHQQLWVVTDPDPLSHLLSVAGRITAAVITDGHHRAAAAHRYGHDAAGASRRLMVALFPSDQVRVAAFHRVVGPPLPLHPAHLPAALRDIGLTVKPLPRPQLPARRRHVTVGAAGRWWEVAFDGESADGPESTDVWQLQTRVLGPVLGIDDPRGDPRLRYVPGTVPLDELLADAGPDAVPFLLHPPRVEDLLQAGATRTTLPPKSTYVYPKARSGLLLVPRG